MTTLTLPALPAPALSVDSVDTHVRVRAAVDAHYDGLWRFVRRMGVAEAHAEDAVQQVLLVFAERAGDVDPAAERSFLFGTALRVASDARRRARRARDVEDPAVLAHEPDPAPDAEAHVGDKERRAHLDALLAELEADLRAVFVLAELEELTMAEIAQLLSIPPGTVASRLRRARARVEARAVEIRARARMEWSEPR